MKPYYITTAIPYVNGAPHLGHAVEFIQADVLARHRRLRGQPVRLLSGTDDHALKNVLAARAAGQPITDYVNRAADRFQALVEILELSCDDYLRTSSDPRHRPGVEYLWQRCAAAGDFYRRDYTGLYCLGCEQFYEPSALVDGRCPEHGTVPEEVSETNWFFRLTRYGDRIREAISSGTVVINPIQKRREVLAVLDAGLQDFSVSRPAERADGWGIEVPGDPSQVIYVWWDALTNYLTALGVDQRGHDYLRWWAGSGERVHVIGKGITRFHAIYWLGLLLSAGEPLPTTIHVHDYIQQGGRKLSKSSGNVTDPVDLVDTYGVDAVRWWIGREVPLLGDTDFTAERLVNAYNTDLANGLGNLANRTITLLHRDFGGQLAGGDPVRGRGWDGSELAAELAALPAEIDRALAVADLRSATAQLTALVTSANQLLNAIEPWKALRAAGADRLDLQRLLSFVVRVCRSITAELGPFCPNASGRLAAVLGSADTVGIGGPVLPRLPTHRVSAAQRRRGIS